MQREIDMLRSQPPISPPKSREDGHTPDSSARNDFDVGALGLVPGATSQSYAPHKSSLAMGDTQSNHLDVSTILSRSTAPRSLDGVHVDHFKIDDCFSL